MDTEEDPNRVVAGLHVGLYVLLQGRQDTRARDHNPHLRNTNGGRHLSREQVFVCQTFGYQAMTTKYFYPHEGQ